MRRFSEFLFRRLLFGKELYVWGWRWVVLVVWGLPYGIIGAYDTAIGQGFLSSTLPELASVFPDWLTRLWLILGLVAFFIVTFEGAHRIVTRERNKLRETPKLSNRPDLLKVIAEAKIAAIQVAENIKDLKLQETGNVIFQDSGRWDELARIRGRFKYACESLDREIYVAGIYYEPVLRPLYLIIKNAETWDSSPDMDDYKRKLEDLISNTRNKIDGLIQPVPDKECYQKQ